MTQYRPKPETTWKVDPNVEAARKLPGWGAFHRECSRAGVSFDHIERDGKRGPYRATAFTVERRRDHYASIHLADGSGKTVLDALGDAYRRSGRATPETDAAWAVLTTEPEPDDDFADLIGTPVTDYEDMIG